MQDIKDYLNAGLKEIDPALKVDEVYNNINAGLIATIPNCTIDPSSLDEKLSDLELTAPIPPVMVTDVYEHNNVVILSLKKI
jgi:hypothetical protein